MNKTHIVALGGAGTKALEYIYQQKVDADYTYINYPQRDLSKDINFVKFFSGLPFPYYPDGWLNKKVELSESIKQVFFNPQSHYVLLAGLGGYTGSSLVEAVYDYLTSQKIAFDIICSFPFSFEGKDRMKNAKRKSKRISKNSNFIALNLNELRKKNKKMLLSEAFVKADIEFYNALSSHL